MGELHALRVQLADRDVRLNQLENRLSLIEAEQRQMRFAVAEREPPPGIRETVRIGERSDGEDASDDDRSRRKERQQAALRPVLRLYEERARAVESEPLMPVPIVGEKLPSSALPVAPVPALPLSAGALPAPPVDPGEHYRRAIDLVRQRDFQTALASLNDFLVRYSDDSRAGKAMFWRGEVLFAQRRWERALDAFETALAKDPAGEKAPESLLKIGLCHKRLGATERARATIERLKSQYPNSDAARVAAEEDV